MNGKKSINAQVNNEIENIKHNYVSRADCKILDTVQWKGSGKKAQQLMSVEGFEDLDP